MIDITELLADCHATLGAVLSLLSGNKNFTKDEVVSDCNEMFDRLSEAIQAEPPGIVHTVDELNAEVAYIDELTSQLTIEEITGIDQTLN